MCNLNLVKLYASGSTNEDLKLRFRESELPNLTTLFTHTQLNGKGQRGTSWESEPHKNLTFSILLSDLSQFTTDFQITKMVSVALVNWLKMEFSITSKIKWPNDILSVNHKLAGILIETVYKGSRKNHAIVGIGLNVNQTDFIYAPKAISMKQITGNSYDLDALLISFLTYFEKVYVTVNELDTAYLSHFYKLDKRVGFLINKQEVNARVLGVNKAGKLLLEHHDSTHAYELKEVRWLY